MNTSRLIATLLLGTLSGCCGDEKGTCSNGVPALLSEIDGCKTYRIDRGNWCDAVFFTKCPDATRTNWKTNRFNPATKTTQSIPHEMETK